MPTRSLRGSLGNAPPTTIRLPPEMRDALVREAEINRRTLSSEIVDRLGQTLHGPDVDAEVLAEWERTNKSFIEVSDAQRMLLSLFDAMPPDKQLALLTVLKR